MGDIPTQTLQMPVAEVRPGDVVAGKYRITQMLGRGGMGVVLRPKISAWSGRSPSSSCRPG